MTETTKTMTTEAAVSEGNTYETRAWAASNAT